MKPGPSFLTVVFGLMFLSACQSGTPSQGLNLTSDTKPVITIAAIGKTIQKCWFKTGNPIFKPFKMANESNSYAGRPRLLLVPKNNPGGLPKLVIQAEKKNGVTQIEIFGPLLSSNNGSIIAKDLKFWATGNTKCQA